MDSYMLIFVLVSVLITTTIAVILVLVKRKQLASGAPSRPGVGETAMVKPGRWQGKTEGVDYNWMYHRGSRNSPSYLSVTMDCQSPGSFKITKETGFDRFFKKLGICIEIKTHDTEFDDKFYITTNTVNFTNLFFSKSQKRRIINEIYDKGFNEISHNGKVMMAKCSPFRPGKQFDMTVISEIAALLDQLTKDMPIAPTPQAFASTGWKVKRAVAFAVPVLLEMLAVTALVFGIVKYTPLDGWQLGLSFLKYSIPPLIIFLWLAAMLLKGRSSSHREFIIVVFLSFFAFILAGPGLGIYLNGYLDKSQPVIHETVVLSKYISRSKDSTTYYANVESWRADGGIEAIRVSSYDYDRIIPRKTEITVTTKPGKFKHEWLVGYKVYFE